MTTIETPKQPAVMVETLADPEAGKIILAPQVTYTQYQIELRDKWTNELVLCTLREHEGGQFHMSAQLAEGCRRNDRIFAALRTRVMGALGLPFSFEAPDGYSADDPQVKRVMGLADKAWARIPESILAKVLRDLVMLGFSLCQIHWDYQDGFVWPRLEPWDAQWCYYDHNEKCYKAMTREGSQIRVNQGDRKWILFLSGTEDDSWLNGAIRPLGLLYLLGQVSWVDWANFNERHGNPLLLAKIPAGAKGDIENTDANKRFFNQLKNLKKAGVVQLPQHKEGIEQLSYALELLESKNNGHETFEKFKTTINIAIALVLLGQHLTSETGDIGTQALGRIHENVRQDLMEADTTLLSSHLHEQLFKHWAEINFGSKDLAPWPCWDATPPPDQKLELDGIHKLLESAKIAKELGAPVDLPLDFRAIAKKYGMPLDESLKMMPQPNNEGQVGPPKTRPDPVGVEA